MKVNRITILEILVALTLIGSVGGLSLQEQVFGSLRDASSDTRDSDSDEGSSGEEDTRDSSGEEDTRDSDSDEGDEQTATQDEEGDEMEDGNNIDLILIDEEGQSKTIRTSIDRMLELVSELRKQNSLSEDELETIHEILTESGLNQGKGKPDYIKFDCNQNGGNSSDIQPESQCAFTIGSNLIVIKIPIISTCFPCSDGSIACWPQICPPGP